jgi:SAM-dependent methyltransferase
MSAHTDRTRAESFGRLAEQYDRRRPGYPEGLCADLLALRPGDVLDVGCGTGKASMPLSRAGVRVLGVEIDERMADVARSHGLAVEVAPFERWDAGGRSFDLVLSAQAWHWVDPAQGARAAAAVLRPGGRVALVWNLGSHPPELKERLDAIYAEHMPGEQESVLRGGRRSLDDDRAALAAAGLTAQEVRTYPWRQDYTCDEWIALLRTHSDHATLPDDTRERLLERVAAVIEAAGGRMPLDYETRLLLAAR